MATRLEVHRQVLKLIISTTVFLLVPGNGTALADGPDVISTYDLMQAARNGDARAMFQYGSRLESGDHIARDSLEAFSWYLPAMVRGVYGAGEKAKAVFEVLDKDMAKNRAAVEKRFTAAKQSGNKDDATRYNIVRFNLCEEKDPEPAKHCEKYFNQLMADASQGDADSMFWLGYAYSPRSYWANDAKHVEWMQKASDKGISLASSKLSLHYLGGYKTPRDMALVEKWELRAAEQGNPYAMFSLAESYEDGTYGKADTVKAVQWFERAARAGVLKSAAYMSLLYRTGKYVPKNEQVAYRWYKVTQLKLEEVPEMVSLRARLSAEEAARAEKEAEEIRKQF